MFSRSSKPAPPTCKACSNPPEHNGYCGHCNESIQNEVYEKMEVLRRKPLTKFISEVARKLGLGRNPAG